MARLEYEFRFRGETWTLDYHSLDIDEWVAAERATGMNWGHLASAIDARSAVGFKTFLWLTMRRADRNLGYSQLKFKPAELEFKVLTDETDEPEGEKRQDPPESAGSPNDP